MVYQANGVNFDGTNSYLARGADLTGNANSDLFSGSFWFRRSSAGTNQRVFRSSSNGAVAIFNINNFLQVTGVNTTPATVLDIRTATAYDDTSIWHHAMWSVDLSDAAKRHLYVDGQDQLTVNTYTTGQTIDFTQSDHGIGAASNGTLPFGGDLADLWVAPGQYVDLSIESNRHKFIGPNGGAVDLGSDGSTPTGVAPLVFLSGGTSTWHTNKGTGGGFTENGALTDAASDPPTEPAAAFLERGLGRGIQRGIMRGI